MKPCFQVFNWKHISSDSVSVYVCVSQVTDTAKCPCVVCKLSVKVRRYVLGALLRPLRYLPRCVNQ